MSDPNRPCEGTPPSKPPAGAEIDGRSDWKVVLQFFLVPLSLVLVLVSVFFGLQVMRRHRPDTASTLRSLRSYEGFMARYVGDVKRWQSGYDLSLLMRGEDPRELRKILPDLTSAFREAGARGDLKLRRYLALALGHAGDPRATEALREGLADQDAETRLFSCAGLMRIGERSALPDLRRAAQDPDGGVRTMAIFALGRLEDRGSIVLLRGALADKETDVRWNAALALAQLHDSGGAAVLVELLKDSSGPGDPATAGVRRDRALNALRGLARLRAPEGRRALGEAIESAADPQIREAARLALASCDAGGDGSAP